MSAAVLPAPVAGPAERPSLGRLALVELRKGVDTRAGAWLLLATAGLTPAVAVLALLAIRDEDRILLNHLAVAVQPAAILLPVVGILLVTAEWSQRTALITFTLVPRRSRVLLAKGLAGLVLSLAAFVLAGLVALAVTAVGGTDGAATWELSAGLVGQAAIVVVVPMLAGLGFGAALLAPAPAIALFFVLPIAAAALGAIPALEDAARWLDQTRAFTPMLEEHLSAREWARAATSTLLWTALPVALGIWRVRRADAQ